MRILPSLLRSPIAQMNAVVAAIAGFCLVMPVCGGTITLVPAGAAWKYRDNGSDQGTSWRLPSFDDSGWASGPAQLGYGDGDEATVVSYGPDGAHKYVTTYFRHEFSVDNPALFEGLTLNVLRDDGAIVYVNGQEVWRLSMPSGGVNYLTWATTASEYSWEGRSISTALLQTGPNLIAVEIHQCNATSTDISLALELVAQTPPITITLNTPAAAALDVPFPTTLSATVSDPQGDSLDVTFYGRPAGPPAGPNFTIVALPDTQNYTAAINGGTPAMFQAQTDWIVEERSNSNIVFVTHLGDISQNGDLNQSEWRNATNALYRLEDPVTTLLTYGIPYGLGVGNHDQLNGPSAFYNQYFGVTHFVDHPYYGGSYGTTNNNHFELFSAAGLDFIIIHLQYAAGANSGIMGWANTTLQTYSNRRAIVVSHSLLNVGNPASWTTEGQAIYNALKANPNLFLMLCGHNSGEGQRTDVYNDHTVYTLLADYQSRSGGGSGWLRILEFCPAENLVRVRTYTPYLDQWETDADSQFTIPCDMSPPGPAFNVVQSNPNVSSGASTSALWTGLNPLTAYEWYVQATDGTDTVNSPVRRFTTAAHDSPLVTITRPLDNEAFVAPVNVEIRADASDSEGVTKVEFWAGSTMVGDDSEPPYALTWNNVPPGNYTLTAVAYDTLGQSGASVPVHITVTEPQNYPPTVSISRPANNTAFEAPATILINADASDIDDHVSKVEFFAGTTLLGEDDNPPFSLNWNPVGDGTFVLTAKAYDSRGAQTTSDPIYVTLSQAVELGTITRGPYLQQVAPDSLVVRWRTDRPTATRLAYGTDPGNLTSLFSDPLKVTDHVAVLTGLQPNTLYAYQMGTATDWFNRVPTDYFVTAPTIGTAKPTRIWVVGDSGTGTDEAALVRNAYLDVTSVPTDLWLMLGDNASANGTDSEFQANLFGMYGPLLPNATLWPALGERDTGGATNPTLDLPYFQIFTLPENKSAGQQNWTTEKYYSFDYANIHVVCLDSMSSARAPGEMLDWLQADLQSTTQPWLIAYWHHPPYSKGHHDSDTETELIEMRQSVLPILENAGVDLVLAGHSHSYERSHLIRGHYGRSETFAQNMKADGGDGHPDANRPYTKPTTRGPNQGTVYVVVGASGQASTTPLNPPHPAMFTSANQMGSLILGVDANRLDAVYLDTNGVQLDHFTILKSDAPAVTLNPPSGLTASPLSSTEISLQWVDNSDGEDGFKLERSVDGGSFVEVATLGANVTAYIERGLPLENHTYRYQAAAFDGALESDYAPSGDVTINPNDPSLPPAAPLGLAAAALAAQVDLTWNSVVGASGYQVKRALNRAGPYTDVGSITSSPAFSDPDVVNGTTYYYVVFAVSGSGLGGANSVETSATPESLPTAPSNLSALPIDFSHIDLAWSDTGNETGFKVERSSDGSTFVQIAQVAANVTVYVDEGLNPSVTYHYRVRSCNSRGDSPPAEAVSATTPQPPAPVLSASPGNAVVRLNWSVVPGALAYQVSGSQTDGGPHTLLASGLTGISFTDATVANGQTYYYVVTAAVPGVGSLDSSQVSAMPQAPPAPPYSLVATAVSSYQVDLIWIDSALNEDGFKVERSFGGQVQKTEVLPPDSTSYQDQELNPGTLYQYRVWAFNVGGDSAAAHASATTRPLPPAAPDNLQATPGNRSVSLTWDPVEGAMKYHVKRAESLDGPFSPISQYGVTENAYLDNQGLEKGKTYYYFVYAEDAYAQTGPNSTVVSATPLWPPVAPSNLIATAPWPGEIHLSWTDNSEDETGFTIARSQDGVNYTELVTTGPDTTYHLDLEQIVPATTYYYRVWAFNNEGNSGMVETSVTSLPPPPDPPTGVTATPGVGQIVLSWNPSLWAETYDVMRSTISGGPYSYVAFNVPATTWTDEAVVAGRTYYYILWANGPGGPGELPSAEVSASPLLLPLFTDGFESGNLTAGGWVASGVASADPSAAHTGSYGALLKKNGAITKVLSGLNPTTATVKYWRRTSGLATSEFLRVQYSFNGQNWTQLEQVTGTTAWGARAFEIVLGGSDLHLRFTLNGNGGNDVAMVDEVEIIAAPLNGAPQALNDTYSLPEDNSPTVAAPGVLGNDTDPEGDLLQAVLVTGPAHGTLSLDPRGGFTYTPQANFHGEDSFTYKADDGLAQSTPATVTLTVTPVNDPPVAVADTYVTEMNNALNVAAPGVLGNDSDVDGDTLSAVLVGQAAHGAVSLTSDGSFAYTPGTGYVGQDSFSYRATDGSLNSGPVAVSITVLPGNDPPVAVADSYITAEDTPLVVNAIEGVLSNDTDPNLNSLTALLAGGPAHGVLDLSPDGSFTYTPHPNFNGQDTFTYTAYDGLAQSGPATVTITVSSVNDPPVASPDSATTLADTPVTVSVLANDSDVDGGILQVTTIPQPPGHGQVVVNAGQTITYTPDSGYTGPDTFSYEVADGQGGTAVAAVAITVSPAQGVIHVENIVMALVPAGKNLKGQANVWIADQGSRPQPGATVSGDWYLNNGLLQSGTSGLTDATGAAVIQSAPIRARSGDTFRFVVTGVVLSGSNYAPAQNKETEDSITVP